MIHFVQVEGDQEWVMFLIEASNTEVMWVRDENKFLLATTEIDFVIDAMCEVILTYNEYLNNIQV